MNSRGAPRGILLNHSPDKSRFETAIQGNGDRPIFR